VNHDWRRDGDFDDDLDDEITLAAGTDLLARIQEAAQIRVPSAVPVAQEDGAEAGDDDERTLPAGPALATLLPHHASATPQATATAAPFVAEPADTVRPIPGRRSAPPVPSVPPPLSAPIALPGMVSRDGRTRWSPQPLGRVGGSAPSAETTVPTAASKGSSAPLKRRLPHWVPSAVAAAAVVLVIAVVLGLRSAGSAPEAPASPIREAPPETTSPPATETTTPSSGTTS
jgi:hypothetical protein